MANATLIATSLYERGAGWTRSGGTNDTDANNTDDGATSYHYVPNHSSDTQYELCFEVTDMPANTVSVTSLYQGGSFGRSGTATGNFRFRHNIGGTYYSSEGVTNRAFPASWNAVTSGTFNPGSGTWTKTSVSSTRFGIRNWADGTTAGRQGYCSYLYVYVDYVPGGMYFIAHMLPLIGTLWLPSMLQAVVSAAQNTSHRIVTYTLEELEQVKEEIRRSQRGYCFVGA